MVSIMSSRSARQVSRGEEPGPSILSIPFLEAPTGSRSDWSLTDRERQQLATIATRLRLPPRMVLFREEGPAKWVFAISEGMVKVFRDLPSGKRRIVTFLFARDISGLAKNGRYVNTAQTVTPVTVYRMPVDAVTEILHHDAKLQFRVLSKVTHELRKAQRRSIVVTRRDAAGRLAMFLCTIQQDAPSAGPAGTIALPMTRSDIGDYLALSLESVIRASSELERRGIVKFEHRHLVRVLDQVRLTALADAC